MNGMTMERTIGKIAALVLVLSCCLVAPFLLWTDLAQAETTGTVRVLGSKSSWRAYRLVAGTVSDGRIGNCSTKGLMNAAFWKDAGLGGSGQEVAEKLSHIAGKDAAGSEAARLGRVAISTRAPFVEVDSGEASKGFSLASGYWLLVSDLSQPMLLPAGGKELVVTAKSSGPTIEKRVQDAFGRWRETSEAAQGQKVAYRIVATVPSHAAVYERLPYRIVDELPAGMWVDTEGIRIAVRDARGRERDVSGSCRVTCSGRRLVVDVGRGNALSVLPDDPGTAQVVVRYEAKLTEKSFVGAKKGNVNLAHLEYPGSPTSTRLTRTEKVQAQLFTWRVRLVKSGSGAPLAGATFELRTPDDRIVGKAVTGKNGRADFPTIASGTYRLVETEAPRGYRRAAETLVTIRADLGARGARTRISARAEGAGSLKSVSVPRGIVTVSVDDAPGSDVPEDGFESRPEGTSGEDNGIPKTGDAAFGAIAALCALSIAGAVLALIAARRRKSEESTSKQEGR